MSRRDNLDRCAACRMHETLCICALEPRLEPRTRLALLLHSREVSKPTNTGQLAARCLARSTVTVFGQEGHVAALPSIGPDEQPLLLYPDEHAVPVTDYATSAKPVVLLVPDGSWRQAHKMRRRIPGLADVPRVMLPEVGPSRYLLRREPIEGGLATLEAIARALAFLEGEAGPAIEAALLGVFAVMVDRTRWLRGELGDAEVTGGLPQAARDANPRGSPARRRE